MNKAENKDRFQPGGSGACEARLYAFTPPARSSPDPAAPDGGIHYVAASDAGEAVRHIRQCYPEFEIGRMELLGIVEMVSGSRLD